MSHKSKQLNAVLAGSMDGLVVKKRKHINMLALKEKLIEGLRSAYWAEKAQLKLTLRFIKRLDSEEVILHLKAHHKQTKLHIKRLEDVFSFLHRKAKGIKNKSIVGLVKTAQRSYTKKDIGLSQDAHILADVIRVGYFEIATYKLLSQIAASLGEKDIAALLDITLIQERGIMSKIEAVPTYKN